MLEQGFPYQVTFITFHNARIIDDRPNNCDNLITHSVVFLNSQPRLENVFLFKVKGEIQLSPGAFYKKPAVFGKLWRVPNGQDFEGVNALVL